MKRDWFSIINMVILFLVCIGLLLVNFGNPIASIIGYIFLGAFCVIALFVGGVCHLDDWQRKDRKEGKFGRFSLAFGDLAFLSLLVSAIIGWVRNDLNMLIYGYIACCLFWLIAGIPLFIRKRAG